MKNKKTKLISLLLCLVMLVAVGVLGVTVAYAAETATCDICGGAVDSNGFCTDTMCTTGYQAATLNNGVYEIGNAGQLYWFAYQVNTGNASSHNAVLTADIVVNENVIVDGELNSDTSNFRTWAPIGTGYSYTGTFDGAGYTISGLYYNTTAVAGMFSYVTNATIENLGVIDSYIYTQGSAFSAHAGGIIASSSGVKMNRCYFTGVVASRHILSNTYTTHAGGLIGYHSGGDAIIENCYVDATITGSMSAGGFIGYVASDSVATLDNSYFVGDFDFGFNNDYFVGTQQSTPTVTNCYYLADSAKGSGTAKTATQFASGEVAYLLNGSVSGGTTWKQTLGSDAYPSFTGKTVYAKYCDGSGGYTNTESAHLCDNGFCANGRYQPATLVDGVYQIGNAGQLYWFAALVDGSLEGVDRTYDVDAVLTADITVNEDVVTDGVLSSSASSFREWTPMGYHAWAYGYYGTFDGQGHTISGLYVKNNESGIGLFSYILSGAIIKNVGILDSYFSGGSRAGVIVGVAGNATIENCYSDAILETTYGAAGGIVGDVSSSTTINNCYFVGAVKCGQESYGPIFGAAQYFPRVSNCYYLEGIDLGKWYFNDLSGNPNDLSEIESKSTAQFASGEVTWLLNGSSSDGVWKQTLGSDEIPNFTGKTVYTKYCDEQVSDGFSNTGTVHKESLVCDNGFCANGCYEPATDSDSDGYYEIYNGGQLFWFAQQVNAGNVSYKAVLMNDIDLEGNKGRIWTPIGVATKGTEEVIETAVYTGTFDGNYNRILNMTTDATKCFQGLFGVVNGATIREVIIDSSCKVEGTYFVGGLVAGSVGTGTLTIESCGNEADVTACGDLTATVANDQLGYNAAGIFGVNWKSEATVNINNCYNSGDIYGDKENGAISGWLGGSYTVKNCLNTGSVEGYDTGRSFARAESYASSRFTNNYSTGPSQNYIKTVTSAQLASGEAAYLLNGSKSGGSPWKQTLGVDAYPNFEGGTVYYPYTLCTSEKLYTNDSAKGGVVEQCAFDDNGFCTKNGCYEPAKLVTAATSTTNAVYEISNGGQMFWFAALVNGELTGVEKMSKVDAYLAADIDLEGREWTPIAADHEYRDTGATRTTVYGGVFDGRGHRIYNLNIQANENNSALFGVVCEATIKNFTLEGNITINVSNAIDVASVVGFMGKSTVSGITSYVNIAFSETAADNSLSNNGLIDARYIGGIVGKISYEGSDASAGTISNCAYYGTIDLGDKYIDLVGGIVAYIYLGGQAPTVSDCAFYGTIISDYPGGFTDHNGDEKDGVCIGGIIGYTNHEKGINVTDCLVVGRFDVDGMKDTSEVTAFGVYGTNLKALSGLTGLYYLEGSVPYEYKAKATLTAAPKIYAEDAEALASGKIAYLLSNGVTDGTQAWYQNLGEGGDAYPSFTGGAVYEQKNCDDTFTGLYFNTNSTAHVIGKVTANGATLTVTCTCGSYYVTYTVTAPEGTLVYDNATEFKPTVESSWTRDDVIFEGVMSPEELAYAYTINGLSTTDITQAGSYSVRVALPGREGTAATVTYEVVMPEPLMNTQDLQDALEENSVTAVYINGKLPDGWTMQADGTITNGTSTIEPTDLTGASSLSRVYLYIVNGAAYVVSAENITDYVRIDTSETYNSYRYFFNLEYATKIDISKLDTTGETSMSEMFYSCDILEEIIFGDRFNTSEVTNMYQMFAMCFELKAIDLSGFDTANVESMKEMFFYCNTLTELDITSFDTSKVTDMSGMFACGHLENIVWGDSFVTSNVTDMSRMFYYDGFDNKGEIASTSSNLQAFIATFDTSKVKTMDEMFGFTWITELDLSTFDTTSLESAKDMFTGGHLNVLTVPEGIAALMHTLGLNEFGDGWVDQDSEYYATFEEGIEYPEGTYAAHRHDDGVGVYYRFSASDSDPSVVDVYCFCGDHVHSYKIVKPAPLKEAGDGVTPVYSFEVVCTMCGEGANCHENLFGISHTIYMYNEETGEYEVVTEVIHAGKYKVDMHVAGAVEPWSYETAGYSANATLEFTVEEKRDFELEGSIDASTPDYGNSTLLGNKPAIIIDEAGVVTVITNYEIVTNDGVNALLLVPEFAEGFEIVGISVNGTVCSWKPGATSSMVLGNGWTVTFTGNETDADTFKIELDKEQGGDFTIDESTTGALFIQIIYQSTSDITENSRFEFGFDLTESKAYTSVYEEGSIAEDREVEIIVTNAVVDVIIREEGEITFKPDQSLEYDGENIGAAEGTGLTAEELAELLEEYIVYYYNGFSFELPADLAAELEAAGETINWAQYITVVWYEGTKGEDGTITYADTALTEAPKNAGYYKVVITAAQNEFLSEATAELEFIIKSYVFDATISGNPAEKPYNGSEQTWAEDELNHRAIDRGDGYLKVDETKYTITNIEGAWTNAGDYTLKVTLTASANYAFGYNEDGTAITEKTFEVAVKITRIAISITAEDKTSQYSDAIVELTYTANETILELIRNEIAAGNLILTITTDADTDSIVGNYTIYITLTEKEGLDNFSEITAYTGIYKITRKVIDVPSFNGEFTYNGLEQGYEQPDKVNGKDALSYIDNKGTNAGKYILTATLANNNYVWSDYASGSNADTLVRTFEWEIKAATLNVVIGSFESVYEEALKDIIGEATGLVNGETLADLIENGDIVYTIVDAAYSTDGNNYLLVGNYAITGTDNSGNYEITFTDGTYTVTKKALAETLEELLAMITGDIKQYTGSTVIWTDGEFTFTYNGVTSTLITITGAAAIDGYDYVNANGKLTDGVWGYYDEENGKLYYTVTITLEDTENYVLYNGVGDAVTSIAGEEVEVFIRQADNKFVSGPTVNGTDDLAKLETVFDVLFGDATPEDKALITIKYYDSLTDEEVAWADLEAGEKTYYVVVSVPENNNWAAITAEQTFTTKTGYVLIPVIRVDSETGNIVLIGQSGEVIYDGKAHELVVIPDGEGRYTVTYSQTGDWIGAGEYKITVTIDENYKWLNNSEEGDEYGDDDYYDTTTTFTYTLVIQRRQITITADDKEITYNGPAPSYTVSVDNMAEGETLAGLLGDDFAALLSCAYAQGSNAGEYTITITMDEATLEDSLKNYDVTTITNGTLTVKKAVIEIESILGALDKDPEDTDAWASLMESGATVEYNSETHEIKVTLPDNANVTVTVYYTDSEGNTTDDKPVNAGKYTVTLGIVANDDTNYEVVGWVAAENEVTLEITKVKLSITTPDHTHIFNGQNATLPTLTEEQLKALISRQDGGAIADFIYDEVVITGLYLNGEFKNAGNTSTTYADRIYATHTFDETNYDIDYTYGDLTIKIEWEFAGATDRPYNGVEVAPGGTGESPADIFASIINQAKVPGAKVEYVHSYDKDPVNVGEYTITARFFDGTDFANSPNTATVDIVINITEADLNVTVDDIINNYLQDYEVTPGATTVEGDGFTPEFVIKFLVNGAWTTDAPTNVGTYDIRVSVDNLDGSNYTAAEYTEATLTINKATLNGVEFDYEGDKAIWEQITTSTDGELINKYDENINVIYTVTNGEFTYVTDDLEAVYEFVADREGTYTLTATVENGDANFDGSTTDTVMVYSVTFEDGEHDKNTEYQDEIDDYLASIGVGGVQYRFEGETATEPDAYSGTDFDGYDFNGWLLGEGTYDFATEVTASITLNIDWKIWTYTVTWYDANGEVITTTVVEWKDNPVYDEDTYGTPTKESDREWNYTFSGWTDGVYEYGWSEKINLEDIEVTDDMEFYAYFDVDGRIYTVIFKVWDKDYDNGDGTFGAYVEVKVVTDAQFGDDLTLDKYHQLTEVTWFRADVWYTDENRGNWTDTVPTPEDETSDTVTLYGAYVFDIGTGDVNADGIVNADDITLYRQWVVGGYIMNVVTAQDEGEIWDYVQNDYAAALENSNIFFIQLVADTNGDSSEDIRDITTIRMAIVGGYGYGIVSGVYVSGDAVTTEVFEAPEGNTDITFTVEAIEGIEVQPYGNEEIVTITDSSVNEIRILLNMTPVNYESTTFTFTAVDAYNEYADVSDQVTLSYVIGENGEAYISITGFECSDSFAYFVSFDLDGEDWWFATYQYRVLYAPASDGDEVTE